MKTETLTMPQLGESVTEGTISMWLVKPGDTVKKYDPIAEVITDKVTAEVPSSFDGVIEKLLAEEGDTLQVGDAIVTMQVNGGSTEVAATEQEVPAVEETTTADTSMKKRYSPAVLKLSGEHGIDLEQVTGTGAGGRITRKDLLKLIESGAIPTPQTTEPKPEAKTAPVAPPTEAPSAPKRPVSAPQATETGDIEIPTAGVRQAIASNMVRAKHEAPHAWLMIEVDVTNLVEARNRHKDAFFKQEGVKLTFLPFFMKATVEGLKKHPIMNSTWAGDKIIQKKAINLSLAVATQDALFVPVVKNADELSIKGIARAIDDFGKRAQAGTLSSAEMQGGTFTVNNTGSFGSIQSAPILNFPQAAILSVESIVKRPVWVNGMFAARDMVNLCMSIDHRVLDGLVAGQFLQTVKQALESIDPNQLSLY
ncbi:dihydrolipoamide acetyltransferase family protein [Exiguobacterium acetylicum]|uniref:dihydrolipoamide acetyltransferase family protein n=1 Tax=Exiguobacterium TaxID=33986 RepID=UPI000447F1E0|nr:MULTISPECIES: dihydrolipoamide acetyltransferase family protein [Exiguobacterium]EZP61855.1 Branched-chain alpha-keto acid dehydrogenase subunit E2 [Exiguobacterium sp. RIT341]KQS44787.1 branched-chain alpha-keto acid dehydrogenase subunit E2 [Exiguobacterium sp. Leaf196]MDQ6466106.1 dihydrolipoamide acetyltransferase family protein [Exiguobacterium acetylicum]